MATINLTSYKPVSGTSGDANQIANGFTAIETYINGGNIADAQIVSAANIAISKLNGYPSDATKFLRGDGTWASATSTPSTNAQTGTTYTLVLGDASNIVEMLNASAITMTVPTNASVAFPVGTTITLIQTGAGQVTVAGAGGVTVNSNPGLKLTGQWAMAALVKRATDTWILAGNISS